MLPIRAALHGTAGTVDPDCLEHATPADRRAHCIRTVHAEQNAICQAAKRGVAIDGATIYVGMTPCRTCAMLLISCGIKKVIAERKYHAGQESEEMFAQAGVELVFVNDEVLEYNKK
mgnify:CR=1 FL=1